MIVGFSTTKTWQTIHNRSIVYLTFLKMGKKLGRVWNLKRKGFSTNFFFNFKSHEIFLRLLFSFFLSLSLRFLGFAFSYLYCRLMCLTNGSFERHCDNESMPNCQHRNMMNSISLFILFYFHINDQTWLKSQHRY